MLLEKLHYKAFKIVLVGVLVCLPLGLASAPVSAQPLKSLSSIKDCSLLSDKDLAEIRGSYDSYSFSMDSGFTGTTLQYTGPLGGTPAFSNLNNGPFTAGVTGSPGNGIYQAVCVAGNNNMVISNTTISITHK